MDLLSLPVILQEGGLAPNEPAQDMISLQQNPRKKSDNNYKITEAEESPDGREGFLTSIKLVS